MIGYQKYLKAIKNKSPMSFQEWKNTVGIVDKVQQHKPLEIRPKQYARPISATFDNHLIKG